MLFVDFICWCIYIFLTIVVRYMIQKAIENYFIQKLVALEFIFLYLILDDVFQLLVIALIKIHILNYPSISLKFYFDSTFNLLFFFMLFIFLLLHFNYPLPNQLPTYFCCELFKQNFIILQSFYSKVYQKFQQQQKFSLIKIYILNSRTLQMTSKYQSILSLYLKHTPQHSKHIVQKNFIKADLQGIKQKQKMYDMMERYLTSLQTHRQYLQFFQIGVVRDNKKKIQNVAKYVGLAIRGIDEHLQNDIAKANDQITQKYSKKKQDKNN